MAASRESALIQLFQIFIEYMFAEQLQSIEKVNSLEIGAKAVHEIMLGMSLLSTFKGSLVLMPLYHFC